MHSEVVHTVFGKLVSPKRVQSFASFLPIALSFRSSRASCLFHLKRDASVSPISCTCRTLGGCGGAGAGLGRGPVLIAPRTAACAHRSRCSGCRPSVTGM